MTTKTIRADEVGVGDLVDLELVPEPFVSDEDRARIYEFEYAEVVGFERETDTCIRIDFDTTSIGFPPDYPLTRTED